MTVASGGSSLSSPPSYTTCWDSTLWRGGRTGRGGPTGGVARLRHLAPPAPGQRGPGPSLRRPWCALVARSLQHYLVHGPWHQANFPRRSDGGTRWAPRHKPVQRRRRMVGHGLAEPVGAETRGWQEVISARPVAPGPATTTSSEMARFVTGFGEVAPAPASTARTSPLATEADGIRATQAPPQAA